MAESPVYKWPQPDQNTSPPDVQAWLKQGLDAADATVSTRILSGPVASVPPTLEPGQLYAGW